MTQHNNEQFQPFSDLAQAFTIGLKPIGEMALTHVDNNRTRYLQEKRQLIANQFSDVFMAAPDTIAAQKEACELVLAALAIALPNENIEPDPKLFSKAPLAACSLLVQEDLVLMRKCANQWTLVAACLCFPSSWNLQEKFNRPMEEIHSPVPGIEGKMSLRINRIFDALKPHSPLWRENWSLEGDGNLRHDRREIVRAGNISKILSDIDKIWLRSEYQTLHKMPDSGDILFTIKIISKTLVQLATSEEGQSCLVRLQQQIDALNPEQLRYKGLNDDGRALSNWLLENTKTGKQK